MKKRIFSLILALVLVIGLLPVTVRAGELSSGLQYRVYTDHVEITGYTGSAASVVIPSSIEGLPVTAIGDKAFYQCDGLTGVTIPDSVTSIGSAAFAWCSNLTSVSTPDQLTSIDDHTFYQCANLTSITIPDHVTSIGYMAFAQCDNLTSISIPDSVIFLDEWSFAWCDRLATVSIADSVTSIGACAFYDCKGLTRINFTGNAPKMDYDVFHNITATAYYPTGNNTWTSDVMKNYGGNITWVAYEPPHVHKYRTVVIAPTCTEQGYTTYTCACGYSYKGNYTASLGHDMGQWKTVTEPTCTEDGTESRACTRCDYTESRSIDAAHSYTASVTAPTCTGQGYTTYTCACGDSYVSDYVDALGHDLGGWVTVTTPSCTVDGSEVRSCSRCDYTETRTVDATGHSHEAVITAPTCTEQGYTTYTCTCGDSYVSDYVDALDHDLGGWVTVTAPACTVDGSESRSCSRCDYTETRTIDATGHSHETSVTAPTCTEQGYTTYTCACGDSYMSDYVDAPGHDWSGSSCTSCGAARENPFTDVPEDSFYYEPVLWAVENGITNGATADTFDPNGQCLRAHVVTFLHRAAESPEPSSARNPFTDVKSSDFFYKSVLWAVEKGITNGVSATEFGSYATCNRAAVVTFLWRAAGSPEPESEVNPFADVKTTDFFYKPVLWAIENGVTNGLSATEFGPTAACNRAQVVTFLYRAYN